MIIKPNYYDKFKCIGSDCDFTCCQEWKIAVDDDTAKKWKTIKPPEGLKTRRKSLEQFTQYKDGARVISLENHVCPFLDENKLCRLVTSHGDEILSNTCAIFPREKHEFTDRIEYTLMPCCPEAIDLLNMAATFELEEDYSKHNNLDELFVIRQFFIEIMQITDITCEEALLTIFYIAKEFQRNDEINIEAAKKLLDELCSTIHAMSFDVEEHFLECSELFYDLIENYRNEKMYQNRLDDIMNGVQTAEMLHSYDSKFKSEFEKYGPLFKKLMAQEIYADLINEDSRLEDIIIRLEWIGLEYSLIRHMCFLIYCAKNKLEYKQVRDIIVLVSRMMGYEEDDIYEYLENSFEDILWEWGYFALVVGK